MYELTNSEFEHLNETLIVGNCPNCGYEGKQGVSSLIGSIPSICEHHVDMIDIVMVICPKCGHISLFKKSDILKCRVADTTDHQ